MHKVATICLLLGLLLGPPAVMADNGFSVWFENFKKSATDAELHAFLYAMPKGGDLHQHLSGSVFVEWWWQLALNETEHGDVFYTRLNIGHCQPLEDITRAGDTNLMFQTIAAYRYQRLSACEQAKFRRLADLTQQEQEAWMNSIRLDKAHEGRDEFFEKHWQRLGDLTANPWIRAEALALNIKAFADEGLVYLEPQLTLLGYRDTKGEAIPPSVVADVITRRLAQPDLREVGMTLRFQQAILRFVPSAETDLVRAFAIVASQPLWVGVNLVGREDDDRGHPLRFLETLRQLRQTHADVRLSIHAGEVDEPNFHIRDTLLLGAERIGHGLNLMSDPTTLVQMRQGPYLIEINLISNLLLEYVENYRQHPFPEFLRTGIPVALSTDDRGMWDSTMTDEFFVAVRHFDLSWSEIQRLVRNSLQYAFLPDKEKAQLLNNLALRSQTFEARFMDVGAEEALSRVKSPKRGFVCRKYQLCAGD